MRIPALTLAATMLLAQAPAVLAFSGVSSPYGAYDQSSAAASTDGSASQDMYWWMSSDATSDGFWTEDADMWSDRHDEWLGHDLDEETFLTMPSMGLAEYAIARTFSKVGTERQIASSHVGTDVFAGMDFDVRAYVAHPCFDIKGETEMEECAVLFGQFGDLSDTWESGRLFDILGRFYSPAPDADVMASWQTQIQDELALRAQHENAGASADAESAASTDIAVRSRHLWDLCSDRHSETNDQNACFQQNMRLLQRTDVHLGNANLDVQ